MQKLLNTYDDYDDGEEIRVNDSGLGLGLLSKNHKLYEFKWWYIPVVLGLLFPYVTIPILFVMQSNSSSSSSSSRYSLCTHLTTQSYAYSFHLVN
jgi:hypothetical protein